MKRKEKRRVGRERKGSISYIYIATYIMYYWVESDGGFPDDDCIVCRNVRDEHRTEILYVNVAHSYGDDLR